jgi:CRISPR/Cas system-associated protein endoribonuclease Cas2
MIARRRDRRMADMPKHDLWRLFHVTERRKAERRLLLVDQPDNRCNENQNDNKVFVFHNA